MAQVVFFSGAFVYLKNLAFFLAWFAPWSTAAPHTQCTAHTPREPSLASVHGGDRLRAPCVAHRFTPRGRLQLLKWVNRIGRWGLMDVMVSLHNTAHGTHSHTVHLPLYRCTADL